MTIIASASRYFKVRPYLPMALLVALAISCSSDTTNSSKQPPDVALSKTVVTRGFDRPLFLTFAPGDSTRLFIVEQGGAIRIIQNGNILTPSFLEISDSIGNSFGERGLLGMAFHPDFHSNGLFFVNYTGTDGATHLSRFTVSADPDVADRSSETLILRVTQPYSNHNAGMLAFNPQDGYLYIGFGDGGAANDPQNRAQNPGDYMGKMLRIDVDGGSPYAIPPDNPFVDSTGYLPEIWALGLRNPWRYAFDRLTNDLYIADVGQNEVEEIDFQPASSNGGENYGWRLKEGTDCFNPSSGCESRTDLIDPIWEYRHSKSSNPCSITGGYVYRGRAIAEIQGMYFVGDYCSGEVWAFKYSSATGMSNFSDYTVSLSPGNGRLVSFGEDYHGELYIVSSSDGTIYRITPDSNSQ